jgi:hypothetical protein
LLANAKAGTLPANYCTILLFFLARKFSVVEVKSGQVIASVNKESAFASGTSFMK